MKKYEPISCDFYDILEALATRRKRITIEYLTDDQPQQLTDVLITDLQTRNKEEFMYLDSGLEIRLDRLISVDGEALPGSCKI